MKVLVTGAAGFIGSYVTRALLWRGDEVVGLDNFNDYYPRKCKEFNIDLNLVAANTKPELFEKIVIEPIHSKLLSFYEGKIKETVGAFKFIEVDITNFDQISEILENEKFDAIIHLAAMAGVPLSTKNPRLYTTVNVDGTVNLLTAAKENNVKKFVFGSSSSVYGNRVDRKVNETDDVMHAVSPYGASKVAGEVLAHAASAVYGINVVVDRIFGPIYGPLQRPYGMLMQRAINYVYNDKKVSIYGQNGLNSAKDSTYIDDQVDGILKCLDFETKFDVFNIGTSDPKSIQDWFNAIELAWNKKVQYEIVETDKGDVASSADISKAIKLLNYQPKVKLEDGVKRQIDIFELMPDWYKKMENV